MWHVEGLAHLAVLGCAPLPQDTVSWPLGLCLPHVSTRVGPRVFRPVSRPHIHAAYVPSGETSVHRAGGPFLYAGSMRPFWGSHLSHSSFQHVPAGASLTRASRARASPSRASCANTVTWKKCHCWGHTAPFPPAVPTSRKALESGGQAQACSGHPGHQLALPIHPATLSMAVFPPCKEPERERGYCMVWLTSTACLPGLQASSLKEACPVLTTNHSLYVLILFDICGGGAVVFPVLD